MVKKENHLSLSCRIPVPTRTTAGHLASVPVEGDIVEYSIACALALSHPNLRAELRTAIAKQAGAQVRRIFGGDRVYVARRQNEGNSERNAAIRHDYWQLGSQIKVLELRYGLKARQIWYIIKS